MELYQEKLLHCCEAYRGTASAQMLMTYRSRTDRLSFDERMTVVRECQEAFAPFFLEMCSLVPRLNESDLLFCALSAMGFSSVIIAECLTITPDAVRMRKLRFRDKVGADVFETLFPTPDKSTSSKQKRNISERDGHVTNDICPATTSDIPLPSVSINPLTSKSMKTKMTFGKAIKSCFKQYFTTKGRASRAEFFYYFLFVILAIFAIGCILGILLVTNVFDSGFVRLDHTQADIIICELPAMVVVGIPLITVAQRRLHDIERSGTWIWLVLTPYLLLLIIGLTYAFSLIFRSEVGIFLDEHGIDIIIAINIWSKIAGIILLIWLCKEGTEGPNRYGPDPKIVKPEV